MTALATLAERAWARETRAARALRRGLVPASLAYGAAVALRNALYDAGWLAATRVPARVVSVGNLVVGGSGKTPAALWAAAGLAARGRRVAIVARGYGKRRRGVVVVGDAGRPLVGAEEGGDEAVMLARRFPGPVLTGERRAAAAALACARFGCDTIVLDDGFQHRALARDVDLVLLAPGSALLPAGRLREPLAALRRAHALLAVDDAPSGAAVAPGLPCFGARLRATALVRGADWSEEPLDALRGRAVVAVAGVARPERFVATLDALGATVRRVLRFPDHHRYGAADVAAIRAAAAEGVPVTTEKDLVKLPGFPGVAVRTALEVEDGERLLDLLAGTARVDLPAD
ncbi:MAG TPA: tetraacyldisaccharide 4'-kinase [Candidatus Binatia bacterium]|jgi:tetraacyldisaccharide 4'-kinase|nr:tetraacyldisaccharide 4'-kinase [Candidatus Binatia bacterium]